MNEHAIDIRGLSVRGRLRTLLSIDRLAVDRGALLGVLGPNGAGKTTLIRCCLGVQRHTTGHVRVLGESVRQLGLIQRAKLRQSIGYVPQVLSARSEIPMTVREVVAIGRTGVAGLFRRLTRQDWRLVDEWIERLGLASLARQGYGEISGGEQRKTLIARAMVQQPQLLLLDEPTANLDLGWRERIVRTVEDLIVEANLTALLVCHEVEILPTCCRRVVVLREGNLIADGTPEGVLTDDLVASLYGQGLRVLHTSGRHAVVPGGNAHA